MIRGIPIGNYTRSKKNKAYAMKAVMLLRRNPELRHITSKLWEEVAPKGKTPNYHMEVVVALWDNNLILG